MDRLQFYKYAMLALVLMNIVLIAFMFLSPKPDRPGPHNEPQFRHRAIDILELDKDQKKTFLDLAHKHAQEMEAIGHQQKEFLRNYFSTVIDNESNSPDLLDSIASLDARKVTLTYDHFKDVKEILSEKQLLHFDKFVHRAMNNIIRDDMPSRRPPK